MHMPINPPAIARPILDSAPLQIFLLALLGAALYGSFLWNPVVFDDIYFFNGTLHAGYLGKIFSFQLRWLPYATFEWTRALLGLDLIWFHLGNLLLHIANVILLFLFLRRLFELVLPAEPAGAGPLSARRLAFFASLIFAVHPAAVYAVAYLSQRSILMATFFTLTMLYLFMDAVARDSRWRLMASAGAYLLAGLSKEHTIMAPAVALALLFLLRQPCGQLFRRVWPVFVLYAAIGLFIVFQVKSQNIIGQAYEINGSDMLARLAKQDPNFDRTLAYPLSAITQSFLFFKYLLLWIAPNPAWMSIDMVERFATRLWSWPYIAGSVAFVLYPVIALRLLLRRGSAGLCGFGLLWPWLLFATELSTVRIQESFVIYRSYLWMAGWFAVLPFFLQKWPARRATAALVAIVLLMMPMTWNRLSTFSHPLLLWDDAASLLGSKQDRPGVERIYHNRGIAFAGLKLYPRAIEDYSKAIALYPDYSYAYHDRGAAYFYSKQYRQAVEDFGRAIALKPDNDLSYLGRGMAYEALGDPGAARLDYQKICLRGFAQGCGKFSELGTAR
jgi:tetratricopeptide (TPR) repeat protein